LILLSSGQELELLYDVGRCPTSKTLEVADSLAGAVCPRRVEEGVRVGRSRDRATATFPILPGIIFYPSGAKVPERVPVRPIAWNGAVMSVTGPEVAEFLSAVEQHYSVDPEPEDWVNPFRPGDEVIVDSGVFSGRRGTVIRVGRLATIVQLGPFRVPFDGRNLRKAD
jgi:hypothetical protein